MARVFVIGVMVLVLAGCQGVGGATAVAPAKVPEGWNKESIGDGKMSLVLPPFFGKDTPPEDSTLGALARLFSDPGILSRTYIGPDSRGKECMVMITAFSTRDSGANPEGAAGEYVYMMGMYSMGGEVQTSKRKVDLPIGPAWRAVVTVGTGEQASSTILYAGKAKGQYYQVMFMESGAGDMVLVPDEEIMDSLRFD